MILIFQAEAFFIYIMMFSSMIQTLIVFAYFHLISEFNGRERIYWGIDRLYKQYRQTGADLTFLNQEDGGKYSGHIQKKSFTTTLYW